MRFSVSRRLAASSVDWAYHQIAHPFSSTPISSSLDPPSSVDGNARPIYDRFVSEMLSHGYNDIWGLVPPKDVIEFSKQQSMREHQPSFSEQASASIYRSIISRKGTICPHCWLSRQVCICSLLEPTRLPSSIRFKVIIPYKEYLRSSNTAHLLARTSSLRLTSSHSPSRPDTYPHHGISDRENMTESPSVDLFIHGIPLHHNRLRDVMIHASQRRRLAVLFPSMESITLEEYDHMVSGIETNSPNVDVTKQKRNIAELSDTMPPIDGREANPLTVLVLDGTWDQAKRLRLRVIEAICRDNGLPPPVYLRIDPTFLLGDSGSLLAPLRTQSQPDRICTLEAMVALIKEAGHLGKSPGVYTNQRTIGLSQLVGSEEQDIDAVVGACLRNLKRLVDARLIQHGNRPVYHCLHHDHGRHTFSPPTP